MPTTTLTRMDRFVVRSTPATLSTFGQALFGPFTAVLQQDIDRKRPPFLRPQRQSHPRPVPEYISCIFQILAQMLSLHNTGVPTEYRVLLPFLLTPTCWRQKGSIPGIVKLLRAFWIYRRRVY